MLFYIIAVILVWCTYRWLRGSQTIGNYGNRYVFITGCDTGFGNMLTKRLDSLGFHVFAGCLSEKGMTQLDDETSSNVVTVQLDVTKTDSIETAFKFVKSKLPKGTGLWGVVNNAGIAGAIGSCQWLTRDDYRHALEVNTLGMIETTRVFLPLVIQSKGRIVNITSIMGRVAAVCAPYVASKYAAEGYSDSLRREMYKRGVTVHILEPGFFNTGIADKDVTYKNVDRVFNRLPQEMQDYFGQPYLNDYKEVGQELLNLTSPDVYLVIDAFTHAITAKYPKYRYIVGKDAQYLFRFLYTCPEWLSDYILARKTPLPVAER